MVFLGSYQRGSMERRTWTIVFFYFNAFACINLWERERGLFVKSHSLFSFVRRGKQALFILVLLLMCSLHVPIAHASELTSALTGSGQGIQPGQLLAGGKGHQKQNPTFLQQKINGNHILYWLHRLTWAILRHNMSVSLLIPVPIRLDTAIPINIFGMSVDQEPQQLRLGTGASISRGGLTLIVILTPRRLGMIRITLPMSSILRRRAIPQLLLQLVRWATRAIQTLTLPSMMSGTF